MPEKELKGRVTIYSIVGCPYCIRAKARMEEWDLPFFDINLDKYPAHRAGMIERTGKKTVPQIFFNEIHVGGFSDLDKLSQDEINRFIKLVTDTPAPDTAPALPNADEQAEDNDKQDFDFVCELDEYATLVKSIKESGIIKEHRQGLKTYKNSFIGKDAVEFLKKSKQIDHFHANDMMKEVVAKHFAHGVKKATKEEFKDDDTIYRFLENEESNALNAGLTSTCEPRSEPDTLAIPSLVYGMFGILWGYFLFVWTLILPKNPFRKRVLNSSFTCGKRLSHKVRQASDVGEDLRRLILTIYNSFLSKDGKKVDYKAIGESEPFKAYVKHTAELQRVKLSDLTRQEKVAFFINIYNACVIHAFVTVGPPMNLWQRYRFFNVVSYIVGGHAYSLNDMENGVLRSNRKAIGAITRPFSKSDPRLPVALPEPETRVHFALVCGAKSCPPIKTYSAKDVDNQLKLSAESFLEGDGVQVDIKKREVKVSQILKWYREDFGKNKKEVVTWVRDHMGDCEKKQQISMLLESDKGFKLSHLPYDWGLNN